MAGEPKTLSPRGRGQGEGAPASPDIAQPPHPNPLALGERETWPQLSGRLEGGTHILPIRVYYEDTDFSGVVYHASYLRFLERGRTDLLRLAGIDQATLRADGAGMIFAVRRMAIDFLRPARMDDVLVVETRTEEVRGASLVVIQTIRRASEVILSADVRVAALVDGRPARIPDDLRAMLKPGPERQA